MKPRKKRISSILLILAMMLGITLAMSATAYADTAYGTYLVRANDDNSILPDKVVHFNGIDWYIIADDSTTADNGTVTLFAKDPIGASKFDENGSNVYNESTVKSVLDGMTESEGAFANAADAIVDVDLSDVNPEVKGAKLWLLSETEADKVNGFVRRCSQEQDADSNFWWLRTAGTDEETVCCVDGTNGIITNASPGIYVLGVRPALKLDLSKVAFDSTTKTFSLLYPLWVGGVQVTSINKGDILGDGSVSYDPGTSTLTLNNAAITDVQTGIKNLSNIQDLTIKVKGENKLSGGSIGIESSQNFTITGDGSLQVEAIDTGIYAHGGVKIEDTTVNTAGGWRAGIFAERGSVTIKDSDVTATSPGHGLNGIETDGEVKIEGRSKVQAEGSLYTIYSATGITIGDGLVITEPENGRISDDGRFIVDQNHNRATSATIEPVYAITLAKTTNGKASLSAKKAKAGAKVKVTATPDKGYILDKMTYTDKDGKTTAIPSSGEITMPASDITVNVTFEKQNVKPEPTKPITKPTTKPAQKPAPVAKVSGTLLAKMTAKGSKKLEVTWNQINGAEGYDIFFVRCNHNGKTETLKKVDTVKGNKTLKWTRKGLKKKKAYKAVVKAYVMKNGKKTYVKTSPTVHAYTSGYTKNFTNPKKVTVKQSSVSLKAGKTYQIKARVKKLKKNRKLMPSGHEPKLRYLSSNGKIATVSSSGKIRAKAKGTCKVYVIAVNGAKKAVTVTVK